MLTSRSPNNVDVSGTPVTQTRQLIAGLGLAGGGDLSANRTFSVDGAVVALLAGATFAGAVRGPTPVGSTDLTTKSYVDTKVTSAPFIKQDGTATLSSAWNVGAQAIRNIAEVTVGTTTPLGFNGIGMANGLGIYAQHTTGGYSHLASFNGSNQTYLGNQAFETIMGGTNFYLLAGVTYYAWFANNSFVFGLNPFGETAAPGSPVLRAGHVAAGTNNGAAAQVIIGGQFGTGNGASGGGILRASVPLGSGNTQHTSTVDVLTWSNLRVALGGYLKHKAYTTTLRNALTTMTEGDIVFNSDTKTLNYYDGTQWRTLEGV